MYEPTGHPNLAFLWPAMVAASAGEMAVAFAKQFTNLAVGTFESIAPPPRWTTPNKIALDLKTVRLRDFTTHKTGTRIAVRAVGLAWRDGRRLCPGARPCCRVATSWLSQIFITDWRSATAEMRHLGIDDYLADLNVLVDEIGPPIDLVVMGGKQK